MTSDHFTNGYNAGFAGSTSSPPETDDVARGAYFCGYRIGISASRELGTKLAELARYSRQAASAFNGTRRDSESMRNDLLMCRSMLERIAHLIVL